MTVEHLEINSCTPKEMAKGLYGAASDTADGEKINLYMELITKDNLNRWTTYNRRAANIASVLIKDYSPNSSKYQALAEIPRAVYARNFLEGDYVVYAVKHGVQISLPETTPSSDSKDKFEQDYGSILMSVNADCTPKTTMSGYIINEKSYANRGIFRNPISIIEGKHKGLAMLLHGFSAAVALKFFHDKSWLEVSPIASMQHILYHSLPREAFAMKDEDYEKIKTAAQSMSGSEAVNNWIKIEALSTFYLETSIQNASKTDAQTSPQEKLHLYKQSLNKEKNAIDDPDKSRELKM